MIKLDRFFEGKRHILTFSFDDGLESDIRLIEILDKYNIKASFHLNSGMLDKPGYVKSNDISKIYKNHEIACHTYSHANLGLIPLSAVSEQIMEDRKKLEFITQKNVTGFAYPMSSYNDKVVDVLKSCGITYARDSKVTNSFSLPEDFMRWHPTCHHNDSLSLCERFIENVEKYNWRTSLFYIYGHSFEFDRQNNWSLIEEVCKKLSGHNTVWYSSCIGIYIYMKAVENLEFSADLKRVYNPSVIPVWISCDDVCVKLESNSITDLA